MLRNGTDSPQQYKQAPDPSQLYKQAPDPLQLYEQAPEPECSFILSTENNSWEKKKTLVKFNCNFLSDYSFL